MEIVTLGGKPIEVSTSIQKGDFQVVAFSKNDIEKYLEVLVPMLQSLNDRAFALDIPTTEEEAKTRLNKTDTVLLAMNLAQPVGFGLYQAINTPLGVMLYQSRGIAPEGQRGGLGSAFMEIACDKHRATLVSGKAQNPASFWTVIRSGRFGPLYPIEQPYSSSEDMSRALQELVKARNQSDVDLSTGLLKRSYKMGKLGDYSIDLSNPGIRLVESRLKEIGMDRSSGDAIYYMAKRL